MATNSQQFEMCVSTMSSLHIGNGEELTSTGEYLTTANRIYFLNQEELMKRLKADDLYKSYIQKILDQKTGFNFNKLLEGWGINTLDLAAREIRLQQEGLNMAANNKLQICIKTKGEAYIPGSSIKGMLRTAILFRFLKENPNKLQTIEMEIVDCLGKENTLRALKRYWENKERNLLPENVFKAIRPCDTATVTDDKLVVEQVNRQSFLPQNSEVSKGLDWLTECIGKEVELPFELNILTDFKEDGFQYLKTGNPRELFNTINDHTLRLIVQERELINTAKPDQEVKSALLTQLGEYENMITSSNGDYAITRMGKGKTLFFQTILPLLKVELRDAILMLLRRKSAESNEEEYMGGLPRSRVLTVTGQEMMGWVKLEAKSWEKMPDTPPDQAKSNLQLNQEPKKLEKKPTPTNNVSSELKKGTMLKAIVTGPKKVEFYLNGVLWANVQLVPHFKHQVFTENEILDIFIIQMSKDGRIMQVQNKQ